MANQAYAQLAGEKPGAVLRDVYEHGIRCVIIRGPSSLCAYVGVPEAHPLAGFDYENFPLDAHGGLTYSGKGILGPHGGWWWYGWDYAHLGDLTFYDLERAPVKDDHGWTVDEVHDEVRSVAYTFAQFCRIAERIAAKSS